MSDAMQILVLSHNFRDFGTYFRARAVASYFASLGHHVTFVYNNQDKLFQGALSHQDEMTILESPSFTYLFNPQDGWSIFDWAARIRHILKRRYDLIFAFGHKPNILLPARHCQHWHHAFVAADWCDLWSGQRGLIREVILPSMDYRQRKIHKKIARRAAFALESLLEKRFCRKSSAAIVISEFLRKQCLASGMPEDKVHLMYSGCNTRRIMPQNRIHCLKELEIGLNDSVLGYLGNVHPDEEMLLGSFARVFEQKSDLRMLVAGSDFQTNVAENYGADMASRIIHLGRLPFERISRVLGACDLLLLPMADVEMNRARWPHKFTDYLAAGRPIVATDVGDVGDFFERHSIGALTRPDVQDFSIQLLQLLNQPDEWPGLGENARQLAEGELSWDCQLNSLREFLERQGLKT